MCPRCPFHWSRQPSGQSRRVAPGSWGTEPSPAPGEDGSPSEGSHDSGRQASSHAPSMSRPHRQVQQARAERAGHGQATHHAAGTLARPRPWPAVRSAGCRPRTGSPSAREAKAGSAHSPASSPPHPRLVSLSPQGEEGPPTCPGLSVPIRSRDLGVPLYALRGREYGLIGRGQSLEPGWPGCFTGWERCCEFHSLSESL